MSEQPRLSLVPIFLAEANEWVRLHHRHHKPVLGTRFAIAAADETETIRAVALVGRPCAQMLQDGWTLEVNRVASDGCPNACSFLYRAAWRAARALGYKRLVTYTLPEEGGASLRGAGFKLLGAAGGGSWSRNGRPRVDTHPLQVKLRWELP